MSTLVLLLWVIAAVLMGLRAFEVTATRLHLGWLGLTVAAIAVIVAGL